VHCQNYQLDLDPVTGLGAVVLSNIQSAPTTDNCAVASNFISAGQTSYTCANVGSSFIVTQKATDTSGNVNTCLASVSVVVSRL
jgi:hypothetical protein